MINKEIYFSLETKEILQELPKVDVKREDSGVEKELLQDPREVRAFRGEMSPVRNIGSRAEEVSHGGGISLVFPLISPSLVQHRLMS